jgi:ABC-type phosphate transport system substrate-binding protein
VATPEENSNWSINILTIDSISPSPENIQQGKYKLVYTIGIVFGAEPNPATQEFIHYIFSEAGKQRLSSAGYVVIKQP